MNKKIVVIFTVLITVFFVSQSYSIDLRSWDQQINNRSRFEVLKGPFSGDAVLDKETGLVWVKDASAGTQSLWRGSTGACHQSTFGGRKGWHLPTIEQLSSLIDPDNASPTLSNGHPFLNVDLTDRYWSATTRADFQSLAWAVSFDDGSVESPAKSVIHKIWCVRGGQANDGVSDGIAN